MRLVPPGDQRPSGELHDGADQMGGLRRAARVGGDRRPDLGGSTAPRRGARPAVMTHRAGAHGAEELLSRREFLVASAGVLGVAASRSAWAEGSEQSMLLYVGTYTE